MRSVLRWLKILGMTGDTGPQPSRSSTWIFTFGRPRRRLMRQLVTAIERDFTDWFLFVIPESKEP